MRELTPESPRSPSRAGLHRAPSQSPSPGAPPGTGPLPIEAFGRTDAGRFRHDNQDAFRIVPEAGAVLVADGVAGNAGGALAAQLATDTLAAVLTRDNVAPLVARGRLTQPADLEIVLEGAITEAHWRLADEAASTAFREMGTTLAVLVLGAKHIALAHLGDSRIYRLRHGKLRCLTRDDTLLQAYVDRHGAATPEVIAQCGHILTSALSAHREIVRPTVRIEPLEPGDVFLVCTDGLTNLVAEDRIAERIRPAGSLQAGVDDLIAAALDAGGFDNVTAVLARLTQEETR